MKTTVCIVLVITFLVAASPLPGADDPREILQSGERAVTKELQQSLSPQEIIELSKEGNRRFVSGKTSGHNYRRQTMETATGQFPPAIVLSCLYDVRSGQVVFLD